jgi:hypothetical protein
MCHFRERRYDFAFSGKACEILQEAVASGAPVGCRVNQVEVVFG